MDQGPLPHRRSFIGPIVLICIGVFFLAANLLPAFHPWQIFLRYWPVILILIGLGKVWDYYAARRYPDAPAVADSSGIAIAAVVLVLVLLLGLGTWHGGRRGERSEKHDTEAVELQGATAVAANVEFPAGLLDMSGGSPRLLDADFRNQEGDPPPQVSYSVDSGHGTLNVNHAQQYFHTGSDDNEWNLKLNDAVPLDLRLNMGAGESNLRLGELNLTHVEIHIGAGQTMIDLTGARKQDLRVDVQGGVGQATIRLPKDVGVHARASGGIGAVNAHGFTKQGDEYTNAVYGKTATTIDLTVQGGVGEIDLDQE